MLVPPLSLKSFNSFLESKRSHKGPPAYQKLRYLVSQCVIATPARHGRVVVDLGLASDKGGQVTESSEDGLGNSSRSSLRPSSLSVFIKSPELGSM